MRPWSKPGTPPGSLIQAISVERAHEMSVLRAMAKKITWGQAAEKMAARRSVEKTRAGKVKKTTFPPRSEIPQTPRDSHFPTASAAAGH